MTTITRKPVRALLACATALALAAGGLLAAAPAGAATADPAPLPLFASAQAATQGAGTASGTLRSLTVNTAGRVQAVIDAAVFRSATRLVIWVDGAYAAETYNGTAFYSSASTSGDATTVTVSAAVKAGQRVQLGVHPGTPGIPTDPAKAQLLGTIVAGEGPASIAADGRSAFTVTLPESVFRSSQRVVAWVDGKYSAETYAGKNYYFGTAQIADRMATLRRSAPVAPGARIEVGIVPGTPGQSYDKAKATILAATTFTTAPPVQVGAQSSSLTVVPRGDTETDRKRENRNLRHSGLEPVGRFVKKGETLTVTLPADPSGVEVVVGQYGPYASLNDGKDMGGLQWVVVPGGTSKVVADRDGLVYLYQRYGNPVPATVAGGVPVPLWTLGQTSPAEFKSRLDSFTGSPFVLFSTERTVVALQRATVLANLANVTEERLRSWDDVLNVTDRVYGLSLDAAGLNRKSAARLYVSSPDTGAGAAYAAQDRISLQVSTGAARKFLADPITSQWGFWHETGHTYQTPQYKWSGMGEVTVNISALSVQLSTGAKSNLESTTTANAIKAYLAKPDATRLYDNESDAFTKLAMWDGLRVKCGEDFFPRLNQQYRAEAAAGVVSPTDTAGMEKRFMKTASAIAGTDLTPYFAMWGLR